MSIIDEMALGNGLWDEERGIIKNKTAAWRIDLPHKRLMAYNRNVRGVL